MRQKSNSFNGFYAAITNLKEYDSLTGIINVSVKYNRDVSSSTKNIIRHYNQKFESADYIYILRLNKRPFPLFDIYEGEEKKVVNKYVDTLNFSPLKFGDTMHSEVIPFVYDAKWKYENGVICLKTYFRTGNFVTLKITPKKPSENFIIIN